ncbi:hypothetical protein H5410_045858, partial [Solanum commersonii]
MNSDLEILLDKHRKKTLFHDVDKLSTQIGADVSVMFFSPSGELCTNDYTSIEKIIDKFFKKERDWAKSPKQPRLLQCSSINKKNEDLFLFYKKKKKKKKKEKEKEKEKEKKKE